jgi:HPt (histidine-containing phosphotransfer) domain-containing protein
LNFVKYAIIHFRLFKNNLNGGEVMNIQEFYDSIDESYENVSSRMMGNQKLVEKFVRKFLDDPTYEQIKEAVNKMDYDEILRTTHTMKGIASNLEFTHLQQKSAKAVDMIRAGQCEEVLPVIGEIEKEYQKVIEQIQKLD